MPGVVARPRSTRCRCRNGGWNKGLSDQPDSMPQDKRTRERSALYMVDEHGVKTLGLKLVDGRDFNAERRQRAHARTTRATLHSVDHHPGAGRQAVPRTRAVGKTIYAAWPATTAPVTRRRRGRAPAGARGSAGQGRARRCSCRMPRRAFDQQLRATSIRTEPGQRDARDEGGRDASSAEVNSRPHHPRPADRSRRSAATATAATARWRGCWSR